MKIKRMPHIFAVMVLVVFSLIGIASTTTTTTTTSSITQTT